VPRADDAVTAPPDYVSLDDLWDPQAEGSLTGAALVLVPMLLGTVLLLGYVVLRACNVRVFPRCRFQPGTWDAWDVGRAAIVFLCVLRVVLGGAGWLQARLGERLPFAVLGALTTNAVGVMMSLFLVMLTGIRSGDGLRGLGLRETRPGSRAGLGLLGALMSQPLVLLATIVTIVLGPLVGVRFQVQPLLREARGLPAWGFVLLCLSAVVVAPVTEEIVFRGFVYATLRRWWGPLGSICASAVLRRLPVRLPLRADGQPGRADRGPRPGQPPQHARHPHRSPWLRRAAAGQRRVWPGSLGAPLSRGIVLVVVLVLDLL